MENKIIVLLLCGVSALAVAPSAWAQAAGGGDQVVVTGSRTITNGNNSPTPVTVQSLEQLQASTPTTIAEALDKLPEFDNGRGVTTPDNGSYNGLANVLNLRGFGTQRNLVLLDGMRAMPTGQDWTVDVTSLPEMLVQRVDVVTGGASAVYGSDAVSGAVNYVLDHNFNGLKADIEGGESSRNDDGSWKFGVAAGKSFMDGKLHLEGSFEHYNSDGIPTKLDRDWGKQQYCRAGNNTVASPYFIASNCTWNSATYGGLVTFGAHATAAQGTGTGAGLEFTNGGATLSPFVHGALVAGTSANGTEVGGDGGNANLAGIAASLKTDQIFLRSDYDFGHSIHGFAQAYYNTSGTGYKFYHSMSNQNYTFSTNNPFLTPAEQAQLGGPNQTFQIYRQFYGAQPEFVQSKTTEWVATAGLNGDLLGDRFNWSAYFTHGSTHLLEYTFGNWNNDKVAAAFNSVVNPANGQIVCSVTLTNPGLYPGCQPINAFGPMSQKTLAYAQQTTTVTIDNRMDDVGGTISGNLVTLPAGPLVGALTGEYRNMVVVDGTPYSGAFTMNCTGLTYNCNAAAPGPLYGTNTTVPFSGHEGIGEVAAEVTAPIFKDMFLARSMEINGAIRYANYSISGPATTWKLGGTWKPVDDFTIRVTRSQDIRAPSLYDLDQPLTVTPVGFAAVDAHTGVQANNVNLFKSGNPNLVPEVAQTWTVGGVYRPSFIPRFSISLDYYNIVMNNAISVLQGNSNYDNICEASGGTSPFCALLVRPLPFSDHTAANVVTGVVGSPLNAALQSTYGADIEANYSLPMSDVYKALDGTLRVRMLASYQPSFIVQQTSAAVAYQEAGYANSSGTSSIWKLNLMLNYTLNNWTVNVQERWNSGLGMDYIKTDHWLNTGLPPIAYTDLTLTDNITVDSHKIAAFVTVQNLLDQQPRIYATFTGNLINYASPVVAGDDVIGRYITVGARLRF